MPKPEPVPQVPGAWPLTGHLVPLSRGPLAFLQRARGYGGVVRVRLGARSVYLVNAPGLVREVLNDSERFVRGTQSQALEQAIGPSMGSADGPYHHRQRRMVRPAFAHDHLATYARVVDKHATEQSESWRAGQTVDLGREFQSLSVKIAAESLFSTPFSAEAASEVGRLTPWLAQGMAVRGFDPTHLVGKLPLPVNRRFITARRRLNEVMQDGISAYRSQSQSHHDLMGLLMAARDPETGESMTDQQVASEALLMLLAGTETVSSALSWASHLLSVHPDTQQRLSNEADSVIGSTPDPSDRLTKLTYTRRVLTECLRLYPPAYLLSRIASTDVELGGFCIPAGAVVIYSFYGLHRDPALFRNADTFDPDRWLADRAEDVTVPAFLPFGGGVSRCIGEGFAWMEAVLVLSLITSRWQLCPTPEHRVRESVGLTLRPKHLLMTLRER